MSPSALLLDFDYTIADSSAGVIESVAHALQRLGRPPADPDCVRATIGLSLVAVLTRPTPRRAFEGRPVRAIVPDLAALAALSP